MIPEILLGPALWGWVLGAGAVFFRLLGFLLGFPFWNNPAVATPIRVAFVLATTALLIMALGLPRIEAQSFDILLWILLLVPELLLGVALGLLVRVILAAAEGMAQMMSMAIGLGFATFVDPGSGSDSSALGRLVATSATLLFVLADFHLPILAAFFQTFLLLPVGSPIPLGPMGLEVAGLGSLFFELSLRLAAPVLATGLMIYLILAVISRVAPQMNLFAIGFAVIIPSGLFVLFWEIPDLLMVFADYFQQIPSMIRRMVTTGRWT